MIARRIIVFVLLASIVAAAGLGIYSHGKDKTEPAEFENAPLFFDSDGEFVVLQFADFHEWAAEEENYLVTIKDSLKPRLEEYVRATLDEVDPDLVVLTGDNIFCLSWMDILLDISEKTMQMMADIFEEKQVYWTYTFGNHDTEGGANKQDFLLATQSYKYHLGGLEDGDYYQALSYKASEDDFRAGNYSIPIYNNSKTAVAYNVYVLDSGSYDYVPRGLPYRYILDGQVDWYAANAQALKAANGGIPVPSLLFTHIPLIEHSEAYQQGGDSIGVWTGISPSDTRSKIFSTALEIGDIKGIFAGHNHYNSYTGFYRADNKSIMMGVTPQAKASSYYDTSSTMYSRVIRLNQDGNFATYIQTSNKDAYIDGVYKGEILQYS